MGVFRNLFKGLTNEDPEQRMGCKKDGYMELFNHAFFKDMEWDKIRVGKHGNPPFKPDLSSINADEGLALNEALVDLDLGGDDPNAEFLRKLTKAEEALFKDIEFNTQPFGRHIDNI